MSEAKTKSCNLTEDEIIALIMVHAIELDDNNLADSLERMNYLNKRLKTFNEPEARVTDATAPASIPTAQDKVGW